MANQGYVCKKCKQYNSTGDLTCWRCEANWFD